LGSALRRKLHTDDRLVGFVLDRGVSGFESYDADEKSLGLFDTRHRAISAVQEFRSDDSR
jgi:hypothetical protein